MPEQILTTLEGHLMRSIVISAALALVIVAFVAVAWWMGKRRLKDRNMASWGGAGTYLSRFSRTDEPVGPTSSGGPTSSDGPTSAGGTGRPAGETRGTTEEAASRFIREAAARAGALRDAWDRSYRESRAAGAASPAGDVEVAAVLEELLAQQRETNSLLRELLDRTAPPRT